MILAVSLVLGILISALPAGFTPRFLKQNAAWVVAILPSMLFLTLLTLLPAINAGEVLKLNLPWAPELGLWFAFQLDGLSSIMALLVSGIGILVVMYGTAYLGNHPALGRFYGFLLLFMGSMLGLVLSSNALLLFIFWELTSISSFFLIGFAHQLESSRQAAWQSLLVTGAGGLALLAGIILLASINGTYEINQWIASSELLRQNPLVNAALVLILIGAATKSAQFPFHFWLPNAMAAPTPISAYLHSATMVKAGVYLLARLFPIFSPLPLWQTVVPMMGLVTLATGALLALGQYDLKKLLAYTTITSLGVLVMLLGLGSELSLKAAVIFLVAHALYKGALFLVAGAIDHAAGTRDIRKLGALVSQMPLTALAGGLGGLSMAGMIPFAGFVAKEIVYEGLLQAPLVFLILPVFANMVMAAVGGWVGLAPFLRKDPCAHAHHESIGFWFPPLLLAGIGLVGGAFPQLVQPLVQTAVQNIAQASFTIKLSLWHGLTPALGLSVLTLAVGAIIYSLYLRLANPAARFWKAVSIIGPAQLYEYALARLRWFAAAQTRIIQNGYLRFYVITITLFTVGLTGFTYFYYQTNLPLEFTSPFRFYDLFLVLVILTATWFVLRSQSRLATIALLGSIGYSIALIYLFYSAPDLAMVQFAIETLTVILFILVIYRLPKFTRLTAPPTRVVDILIAAAGGMMMTGIMLLTASQPGSEHLANYFASASLSEAKGRNIVNVILVDFRGLDTLGEITVLAIAAMGVFALVRLVRATQKSEDKS